MWWILGVLAVWAVLAGIAAVAIGRAAEIADKKEGVNDV
jgi:hypothetical protein